ncbi:MULTISPECIES: hypothetical protein [Pseudomonas syringae group]|uniref:hypothetical protein n=1 Tax=Pseudomonas syringae group TaxID=136849 RepID=UPI0009BF0D9A|nr:MULTISPECIES: hypothetical protein [Pseudomonas syringae group]SPF11162.1 putative membrane protein [Pseudomonas syringae group genomosp. 3]
MRRAKLIISTLIGLGCFIFSFFMVLFPLGALVDYLSRISNDVLNKTGLGFADGDADPSFLWVLLVMMLVISGILYCIINKIRVRD